MINKKFINIFLFSTCGTLALFFIVSFYYKNKVLKINDCVTTSMNEIELCEKSSKFIGLNSVSTYFLDALIVSEDASFYSHQGFDLRELTDSMKTNLKKKQLYRGGSTISQQLIKNVFLNKEKSIIRKLKEAIMTYHLENILSKDKILEKYINVVQFGENLYGIKDASSYYFNKHPIFLSLAQSAFLAHLLPNPVLYSEGFHKGQLTDFNVERTTDILSDLFQYNKIDELEFSSAKEDVTNLIL